MALALQARHGRFDRAPALLPVGKFAVTADRNARACREIPDVAVRRRGQIAIRVANTPPALAQVDGATLAVISGPELLDNVGCVRAGGKRVPVIADFGVYVEVVEHDELTRQGMGVRRDLLAEDCEVRIAVAPLEIAEHLVVGSVFPDHIEDVFDWRWLADFARNRRRSRRIGWREPCRIGIP